jgi:hypothetical protein
MFNMFSLPHPITPLRSPLVRRAIYVLKVNKVRVINIRQFKNFWISKRFTFPVHTFNLNKNVKILITVMTESTKNT